MMVNNDHGGVTVRQEDPAQPDIIRLLENGEANSTRLYPVESNHTFHWKDFGGPRSAFSWLATLTGKL